MSKERKIEEKDLSKITGGAVTPQETTNPPRVGPTESTKSEGGGVPNNPGGPENQAPGGGTSDWSPN